MTSRREQAAVPDEGRRAWNMVTVRGGSSLRLAGLLFCHSINNNGLIGDGIRLRAFCVATYGVALVRGTALVADGGYGENSGHQRISKGIEKSESIEK